MAAVETKSRVGERPKRVPQEIRRSKAVLVWPLFPTPGYLVHGGPARARAWPAGSEDRTARRPVGLDAERVLFSAGRRADRGDVRALRPWLFPLRRSSVFTAVLLLALSAFGGCASAPKGNELSLPPGHAEISVTNLSPHLWQLALRTPNAGDAIRVEVKPRETFAVTMPGGEYVVEQTLLAVGRIPATRQFATRFEAGERYRWDLATLLTTEDGSSR